MAHGLCEMCSEWADCTKLQVTQVPSALSGNKGKQIYICRPSSTSGFQRGSCRECKGQNTQCKHCRGTGIDECIGQLHALNPECRFEVMSDGWTVSGARRVER